MIKAKTVIALAVVAGVAIGASFLIERRDTTRVATGPASSAALLPELKSRINDVAKVVITRGGTNITLERRDAQWTIAERSHYPADKGKLRGLMIGAAELNIVEPKTANKELLPQLGLTDPMQPLDATGNGATLLTFFDANGQSMAGVIVGNERPSKVAGAERKDYYVRKPDNDQSYLVEGNLPLPKKAQDLLEKDLLTIDAARVQRVTITHSDGEKVVIAKDAVDAADFRLVEPASTKPLKSAFEVNNIANTFARLVADDVKATAEVPMSAQNKFVALLETFDGLRVTLTIKAVDGQSYGALSAEFVAPPATATTPATADTPAPAADKTQDKPAASKADPDTVRKEAEAITTRFSDWSYLLAEYQVDNIGKHAKDLFKTDEAPP